jgi:hypothetical protein
MLTCTDFVKDPDKPQCCTSCHEDAALGHTDLCELTMPDGAEFLGCCALYRWLSLKSLLADGVTNG